jgi:hypothetical protein
MIIQHGSSPQYIRADVDVTGEGAGRAHDNCGTIEVHAFTSAEANRADFTLHRVMSACHSPGRIGHRK